MANFTDLQITDLQVGQAVRIRFDAFSDTPVRGHVFGPSPITDGQLSPASLDNTTGTFTKVTQRIPVKITFDPGQPLAGRIFSGLSVETRVSTDQPAPPGP